MVIRKSPKAPPRIPGYSDFSKLTEISIAAAVVLTADYERLYRLVGEVPPAVNLDTWNDGVITTLHQLGFFHHLGHIPGLSDRLVVDGPTLTMPIVSARNADELSRIDPALQELGNFLMNSEEDGIIEETIVALLTSISEAITNVTQHAYPADHDYDYDHVGLYWVSAAANRDNNNLGNYPPLERLGLS